jgi:Tol biopolymer transport system component
MQTVRAGSATCLFVIAACGRIGFSPFGEPGADASGTIDGQPITDGPLAGFSAPVIVPELSSEMIDNSPTLTGDLLEIYFSSDRPGSSREDIWRATRSDATKPWETPVNVAELNTGEAEVKPKVSLDGLTITFAAGAGGNGVDIYIATRATRGAAWGTPVRNTVLSSPSNEGSAFMTSDRLSLYMDSDRPASLDTNLWFSKRTATTAAFDPPIEITELSTAKTDAQPWVDDAQLVMLFASARDGNNMDLYESRRDDTASMWGVPQPLTDLNTTSREEDPWQSADGSVIVFASDREGTMDIYMVSKP